MDNNNPNELWLHYSTVDAGSITFPTYFIIVNDNITKLSYEHTSQQYVFPSPIPIEKITLERKGENLFSYELIYNGLQNNSIVLTYREYTKDLIRGSFTQTLYYNVDELDEGLILYKDVKFKVLEYSNQRIKYIIE